MRPPTRFLALVLALLAPLATHAASPVVINEIFYHAPEDLDDLQWLELYNPTDQPVDLTGWKLDKPLSYAFPQHTSLPAGGYLVVARNLDVFRQAYPGVDAIGPLPRPLGRAKGEVVLLDPAGKRVDLARYQDRFPWPAAADGYSASLERISPSSPGDIPENWLASPMPVDAPKPSGSPGRANTAYSDKLPPIILSLKLSPADPKPKEPLRVEAELKDKTTVGDVTLLYRAIVGTRDTAELSLPMTLNEKTGRYVATLPAQKNATLLRYRVRAVAKTDAADDAGADAAHPPTRLFPAETDLRPTLSAYIHDPFPTTKIAQGYIIHVHRPNNNNNALAQGLRNVFGGGRGGRAGTPDELEARRRGMPPQPHPPRGFSAFVYVDPKSGHTTLFDYLNIIPRENARGYKVHFQKDRPCHGLTSVSIIFEGDERYLLAESLADDLYRRAGNPAPLTEFIRLAVDGRTVGYHLLIEDISKSFLRRNKLRDDGYLYKLLWYGGDLVGQHEKRTYPNTGHQDLIDLVNQLRRTRGDPQWKVIQDNVDVDEVATYFAVNTVLSHWDGFFNNYFTYHDVRGTHKWQMYPWDQDKTWGMYDGMDRSETFFDMPLTYGMSGDVAPGGETGGSFGGGNVQWWRPPGVFSGPLLANPQFRKVFLTKVRDILTNVYTKETYDPVFDQLAENLKDDVALRAKAQGWDPNTAQAQLTTNLQSLRNHLLKRREFLLSQPELKALDQQGTTRPAAAQPAPAPTPPDDGRLIPDASRKRPGSPPAPTRIQG